MHHYNKIDCKSNSFKKLYFYCKWINHKQKTCWLGRLCWNIFYSRGNGSFTGSLDGHRWLFSIGYLGFYRIHKNKKLTDIEFIGFSGLRKWFFSMDLDFLINVCWTPINFWNKSIQQASSIQEDYCLNIKLLILLPE